MGLNLRDEWRSVIHTIVYAYIVLAILSLLIVTMNSWFAQPLSRTWLFLILVITVPLVRLGRGGEFTPTNFLAKIALGFVAMMAIVPGLSYAIMSALQRYPDVQTSDGVTWIQALAVAIAVSIVAELSFRLASFLCGMRGGLFDLVTAGPRSEAVGRDNG